ncbi:D-glucuronyl C5-epimerase [Hydrogenimonas sp.]|nr:D-glucuronyl C5-epimerase [Hydrogenimonas sp.]
MSLLGHGKLVTVLQYFTDRIDDYWHILYPLTGPAEREADPYLYFYDISRKATDFKGPFSDEGVYLFKGYDGKWHIHALEISQYALACWLAWRKADDATWRQRALVHCDWLVKHQQERGEWCIGHKNPRYADLPDRWSSALAQALAISALLRAWRYSDEVRYLQAAERAAAFLEYPVEGGGLKRMLVDGNFIYEEYPRLQTSGVLNGYISAVLALRELAEALPERWEVAYTRNIANLLRILPQYDTGYWSLYALDGTLSSGFYHRYVTTQLEALGEFEPAFLQYAKRFEAYTHNLRYILRALRKKVLR